MKTRGAGLVLLFALSRVASADSDGYFCVSDGYLAYELREWSAPERRHVLRIIFVGREEGISVPHTVSLEDFQVHGMKCTPTSIVILSWDRKYTLGLSGEGMPRLGSVELLEAGRIPKDYRADSLAGSRKARTIRIPSSREERRYEVEITYRERRTGPGGAIRHETTSTLVEKDPTGKVLREKVVYTGVVEETVD